jgi:hypothetical protein
MTWLTSLPTAVLVISGLVLALLVATGGRIAVRALIPAADREGAHAIAAPLMPALGAIFAAADGPDAGQRGWFPGIGAGNREQRSR